MFTGIITAIGTMREVESSAAGLDLIVAAEWNDIAPGESVAIDGACLTVTRCGPGWFAVHVVATSLDRTAFVSYRPGRRTNLERALRAGDRLGGHLVQGHVDGVGIVRAVTSRDDARLVVIEVPADVAAVSIPLGSITVDGVALTVDAMPGQGTVQVSVIPFTLEHTTLGERTPGDRVHLEGDLVGKYLRQFWASSGHATRNA
ncbi:MAG: riboflavin synthase [Gemmatimonadales bacterium]